MTVLGKYLVVAGIVLSACAAATEIEFESEYFNDHREFNVEVPIILYGTSYTNLAVHSFGLVVLGPNVDAQITSDLFPAISLISPYYFTSSNNKRKVSVSVSSAIDEIGRITDEVRSHFSGYSSFQPLQVVKIKWDSQTFFGSAITTTLIIASSPQISFAKIVYEKDPSFSYDIFKEMVAFQEVLIGFSAGDKERLFRKDNTLYSGDDYYTEVLIGESIKKTEHSGSWYYMIGDRSLNENNANTQVGTPDQMVDPITKEIVDINECLKDTVCHSQAKCRNKSPGFECSCVEGYVGDGTICLSKEAGVKIYGQITGNVNGKSLDGIDRTIIIKSVGQIISTIKPLNDENLKNTFSALIMLNGAPACFFTESAIPNIKNGNQLSKDAIFSSKTTVVFGDDPDYKLEIEENFLGFSGDRLKMNTVMNGKTPNISSTVQIGTVNEQIRLVSKGNIAVSYDTVLELDNGETIKMSIERQMTYQRAVDHDAIDVNSGLTLNLIDTSFSQGALESQLTASLSQPMTTTTTTTTKTTTTTTTSTTPTTTTTPKPSAATLTTSKPHMTTTTTTLKTTTTTATDIDASTINETNVWSNIANTRSSNTTSSTVSKSPPTATTSTEISYSFKPSTRKSTITVSPSTSTTKMTNSTMTTTYAIDASTINETNVWSNITNTLNTTINISDYTTIELNKTSTQSPAIVISTIGSGSNKTTHDTTITNTKSPNTTSSTVSKSPPTTTPSTEISASSTPSTRKSTIITVSPSTSTTKMTNSTMTTTSINATNTTAKTQSNTTISTLPSTATRKNSATSKLNSTILSTTQTVPNTTSTPSPTISSNAIDPTYSSTTKPTTTLLKIDYIHDPLFYQKPKPEEYLLVAQSGVIKRIDLDGRLSSLSFAFKSEPRNYLVDVDYDCQMEDVYFSDAAEGYIGKIGTNSPSHEILYQGLSFPEGIAVDWVGRRIYWTESKSKQISVGFLDGTKSVVLFNENVFRPRDILCDPHERKIYWTDWNYFLPKIEVADMSGRNRRVLLDYRDVGQPNTLTMDYKRKRLCWTDYKYLHVACMKLDGKRIVEIISREVEHPFSISNSDSILYWTDWKSDRIQRQSIGTNRRLPSIKPGLLNDGRMYGIKYVHGCPDSRKNKFRPL